MKNAKVPCVIDADGLNLLSQNDRIHFLNQLSERVILTPHMKEMERLLYDVDMRELKEQRFKYLQEFVEKYPAVCVLKDTRTVVARRGSQMYVNTSGNAAMAKGGAGDVLTGVLLGLLAQKMEPFEAACLGVYLHGTAGDLARDKKGAYGVLARDLVEALAFCGKTEEA